jgi:hypothetical protein
LGVEWELNPLLLTTELLSQPRTMDDDECGIILVRAIPSFSVWWRCVYARRVCCREHTAQCGMMIFFETPFYFQYVHIHSANWCEDWVLWLGEGDSVVPFRSY